MLTIEVIISDDHPVVRQGIREVLNAAEGIHVVGEASTGEQTLRLAAELQPDVLVLDMQLPDLNGVEVVKRLRAAHSTVQVLGLSMFNDREYIREMLALGAAGYLTKDEAADLIVEAIRGIARGEKGWVSRKVAGRLGDIMNAREQGCLHLTRRETEVLSLVVAGKTNSEIALQLDISDKTVEKHLVGVYTKLGVASRVEAAVAAVRKDLVKIPR